MGLCLFHGSKTETMINLHRAASISSIINGLADTLHKFPSHLDIVYTTQTVDLRREIISTLFSDLPFSLILQEFP